MKAFIKLVLISAAMVIGLCCKNQDKTEERLPTFAIFVTYSFWGEEDKGFVTGLLQFRMNGVENTPSRLKPPAKVELDGEEISPDSAGISGSFYEVNKPLDGFTGEHTIVLTTARKEKIIEKFTFSPFQLLTGNDTRLTRDEMLLSFEGLKDGETVRIVMTDTSFSSGGINEVESIRNNQVDMRPKIAGNINNGPVVLQIFREEERIIRGTSSVGGKISVTYSLKKEFDLVD